MKIFLSALLFICHCSYGAQVLDPYFSYLDQLQEPKGNYLNGEIEIVTRPDEILQIQTIQQERLLQKGFSEENAAEFSKIGVIKEDQYWLWLRDAVYFPKKIPGTYNRLIWKTSLNNQTPGIAIMPILPSGRVVLVLNYRHATRSWELELPRGITKEKETLEEAALRELKEETGMEISSLTFLGTIAPDTGVLSSIIPIFLGKVSKQEDSAREYSEAIEKLLSFSKEELKKGLMQGFLEVSLGDKMIKAPLRDSFLAFALLQAEIRHVF